MSLDRFAQRMNTIAAKVVPNVEQTVRKVALAADQAVVFQTPVDTGRARGNWIASINAPITEPTENTDKGGAATIAEASRAVAQYRLGGSIYITNNVPYIQSLNDGSSAQAPAGFVQDGVRAATAAIQGARILE